MANYVEPIVVNSDYAQQPLPGQDIYETRHNAYRATQTPGSPIVTICIVAYNRLDKTKNCIKYVLEHTSSFNYELMLVDNGSTDDTLEFFQSISYSNKKIIKITKNIGSNYAIKKALSLFEGKYFVLVPNDAYVTVNWLSNLLICLESDDKIGIAAPMGSNLSNLQSVDLGFSNLQEMQEKAAQFNVHNPLKWEERMRLIAIVHIFRRDILDIVGIPDQGFYYDFTDDDYFCRIRRAGYKLVACGDTFVHHDHDYKKMEGKNPEDFEKSLESGRKNYRDKFYGLDPWNDMNNFDKALIGLINQNNIVKSQVPFILGIDVRCGTPILEIRNKLRTMGILNLVSMAFTTTAKYYLDLCTICNNVYCDRIDFIQEHLLSNNYDFIILGEPINLYNEPIKLLQKLIDLGSSGATILFKLRNTYDARMWLNSLDCKIEFDNDMPINIHVNEIRTCLATLNISKVEISTEFLNVNQEFANKLSSIIQGTTLVSDVNSTLHNLLVKDYLFCIKKD